MRYVTLLTALLLCCGLVQAATYTATPATYTSMAPRLRPGDTLLLQPGTYGIIQQVASGASWSVPVRIIGSPGAAVRGINLEHTRYVSFERLTIDCAWQKDDGVWFGRGAGYLRIQDSEITQCRQQGILIPGYSLGHNQFVRLRVHHNGTRPRYQHGLYISAADNLIADSHIHHNAGYGVHVYASAQGTANRNIVRNNQVYNNGTYGGTTYGILLQDGERNAAINNTLRNNNTGDIQVGDRTRCTILRSNQTSGALLVRAPLCEGDVPDLPETPPGESPVPPMPEPCPTVAPVTDFPTFATQYQALDAAYQETIASVRQQYETARSEGYDAATLQAYETGLQDLAASYAFAKKQYRALHVAYEDWERRGCAAQ